MYCLFSEILLLTSGMSKYLCITLSEEEEKERKIIISTPNLGVKTFGLKLDKV